MHGSISMTSGRTRLRPQHTSDEGLRAGGAVALALYRGVMSVLSPAAPALLRHRARLGKEDASRLGGRYGLASRARPAGTPIWIHGASVGGALAGLATAGA